MDLLGKEVRDKVTGFQGICTGRAEYLYGCTQYSIVAKAKVTDGKLGEASWFDAGRLEVIGDGIAAEEVAGEKPGGPNADAPTL